MWINITTGKTLLSHSDIRSDCANTSFPAILTDEMIAEQGYWPVTPITPDFDPVTQSATELAPVQIDGVWMQQWQVRALYATQAEADAAVATARARSVAARWEAIKTERDRRKALGVKAGEHWFHSDDSSRIQQLALMMMGANMPEGLQWKTLTPFPPPVFVIMTQTLATGIFHATAISDAEVFSAAETHRLAMDASENPVDYDFSGGWPAAFGDAL